MQGAIKREVAHMEEGIAAAGVQVEGTFNVKRFFETLALILSRKENVSITVKVYEEEQQPEKAAVQEQGGKQNVRTDRSAGKGNFQVGSCRA